VLIICPLALIASLSWLRFDLCRLIYPCDLQVPLKGSRRGLACEIFLSFVNLQAGDDKICTRTSMSRSKQARFIRIIRFFDVFFLSLSRMMFID
jgi:hypothetical protein